MFKTYDLLIAAVLNYKDYHCSLIKDFTGLRCSFQFEGDKEEIKKIVDTYWKEEILVEPKKFNDIILVLKSKTKKKK